MTWDCCALAGAFRRARLDLWNTQVVVPTAPENEPITIEEARWHLRIDTFGSPQTSDDDPWLQTIGIPAARMWAEGYTGLSLAPQTIELVARRFPRDYFELPAGPVQYVESVMYLDTDGVDTSFTDYELNRYVNPARLAPAYGFAWPAARDVDNSVRVRYVTGYSPAGYSPAGFALTPRLRIGILLMLGHLFENREDANAVKIDQIPNGARVFLDYDRVRLGFA